MASVALIAVALALLRAGTANEYWLGELVPFSAIGLLGLAMALVSTGRIRRFFAGLAATGVLVGLAFWVGPHSFRTFVLERVLLPIDDRLAPHSAGMGMTHLEASLLLWVMETPETRRIRLTRSPFWSRESQAELGCLELAVAVVGGLLAATFRPRTTRPSVTTDD